ncbi:MAG TPA: (2Fe-2S)-binding protein [Stellaceae bacterium]|nr:(2Fe-2S)-binding protein [Stellaceae bacterium]
MLSLRVGGCPAAAIRTCENDSHLRLPASMFLRVIRRKVRVVAMYICLCNALTERQVRQAAASCEDGSTLSVYRACGTQPRCGKCMPLVEGILREFGGEPIHAA